MKQYRIEIEHFGSCLQCLQVFSLHQKYDADTDHVYGEIEMYCPACNVLVILDLEKVRIERIAERTQESIEDLLFKPTRQIGTYKKEPKKVTAKVTRLIPNEGNPDDMLNVSQVSRILKSSRSTLFNWRKKGRGPDFIKLSSGVIQYQRSDVDKFIKGNVGMNFMHLRGKKDGDC